MTSRKTIDEFLGLKRIAVVGVSSKPKDFTRALFREFGERGYDLVPVNPNASEIDGIPAVTHVSDASPAVGGALLLTRPKVTNEVVQDCYAAGVRHIWMYRGAGTGAVSPDAVAFCADNRMNVVDGECPFMFFANSGVIHNVHGFCRKLVGRFPK